jgi:uncharacterized integral membrane protein
MIVPFIAGALVAAVAILFAFQNSAVVTVTFLGWSFQGSMALILCLAFLGGGLVVFLGMLPGLLKRGWRPFKSAGKPVDAVGPRDATPPQAP